MTSDSIAKQIEAQVWQRLTQVLDPELNINLVDLGLVYLVEVRWQELQTPKKQSKRPQIYIQMTLTTPGCPLAAIFDPMIRENLLGLTWENDAGEILEIDAEGDVEIDLTFDPPWVIDMMSEEARAELGF